MAENLYNYEGKYKSILRRLDGDEISKSNAELLKQFDNQCVLEKLSLPRRIKLLGGFSYS